MNRSDIDYIIEKLDSYKPDNIYDGFNSVREKQDQRVSEVLDSLKAEFESDYENGHTPMPKELIVSLSQTQLEDIKRHVEKRVEKFGKEHLIYNWIKCSEKMPENGKSVLVVIKEDGYTDICVGETYGEGNWMISGEFWYEKSDPAITHWMPLPELPKGER